MEAGFYFAVSKQFVYHLCFIVCVLNQYYTKKNDVEMFEKNWNSIRSNIEYFWKYICDWWLVRPHVTGVEGPMTIYDYPLTRFSLLHVCHYVIKCIHFCTVFCFKIWNVTLISLPNFCHRIPFSRFPSINALCMCSCAISVPLFVIMVDSDPSMFLIKFVHNFDSFDI